MTLDKLEAIAKSATPGPWERSENNWAVVVQKDATDCLLVSHNVNFDFSADIRHIAAWNPARALKAIALLREAQELLNDAACDCFPEGNRHYSDCAVLLHRKWLADLAAFEKE